MIFSHSDLFTLLDPPPSLFLAEPSLHATPDFQGTSIWNHALLVKTGRDRWAEAVSDCGQTSLTFETCPVPARVAGKAWLPLLAFPWSTPPPVATTDHLTSVTFHCQECKWASHKCTHWLFIFIKILRLGVTPANGHPSSWNNRNYCTVYVAQLHIPDVLGNCNWILVQFSNLVELSTKWNELSSLVS